ncbi:uncharacterized protein LOC143341674 [Colletes latitarsis]|uniref:uncharacterized protein LOC143341674 n=1 Tax=Colletes latitarsis TaxID=2605962 RepID=UPI0040353ACA
MYGIQNITRKTPQLAKFVVNQRRTYLSTPPRCRVSFAEKMLHGAFFYVGVMAVPMWIAYHVRDYNGTR